MKDEQGYLERMKAGLYDKCWWLANIDTDVNTIIDFGCASGDLFRFIEAMYPSRFIYVGIDNNQEFLGQCPQIPGRTSYFDNLYEATGIDWDKAILVMNSVCHEIYSYVDTYETKHVLQYTIEHNVRHIAIRDMYFRAKKGITIKHWTTIDDAFAEKYPEQYVANTALNRDWRELAMKYTYTENWAREVQEKYFHPTLLVDTQAVVNIDARYNMNTQYFYIPQQIKRIERDIGVKWPELTTTHVKIWISR